MLKQHLILGIMWIIFCVLHSILANARFKKWIAIKAPDFYKNYRFCYILLAFATLGVVIDYQLQISSPLLLKPSTTFLVLGWTIMLTGAFVMFICIKKYFLNLSGLKSLVAEEVVANELRIDGVHRFVRHPLYLGTFIFIWGLLLLYPHWSLLIANSVITIYTLIAIRFEEQKLIEEFGEAYITYQKKVPMILPTLTPWHASPNAHET
ncbi:methyltransferase family protein [Flavisolibacter tropicus]|uniref:methyltransferase family protein n=1 Tax=Flavisolibacter tropicus TaxID=1492898 RepID=UPI000829B401|nr:isoprenylcysteine carboxylmethyltransferase family protein [Flavisolibacter tropicus]